MLSTWFSNTYLCHQIALRQRSPLKVGYSEDKLLFSSPWNGSISSFNNRLEILPFLALNNVFHLRYEKNCGIRKKEMWIQVSSYLYFHFHYCSGTLGNWNNCRNMFLVTAPIKPQIRFPPPTRTKSLYKSFPRHEQVVGRPHQIIFFER